MILAVLNPRGAHPKSVGRNLLVAATNLIVKLPIPIGVTTKGFADPHFHRERNASTDCGTRLHVMSRAPNSWINSAKLWMEPFRSPLNHLNVVGCFLTYQRVVVGVERHHMDVMTNVLYRVRLPIVVIKRWPCESALHWGPFNLIREQRPSSSS